MLVQHRAAYGLAKIDIKSDPTLKRGDIVATPAGLATFAGAANKAAQITPVEQSRGLSDKEKQKLSRVEIGPNFPAAALRSRVEAPAETTPR